MNILEYENYQEKIAHGDVTFPYITYPCSIPVDFRRVPLHWHDEMEFIYIKKGKGVVTVDFQSYQAETGDIFVIIPGQLHSIEQKGAYVMEYENIIFHPHLLLSRTSDACNGEFILPVLSGKRRVPTVYHYEMEDYWEIASCLDASDEIRKTFPPGYQLYLKSQLFRLFYFLAGKSREPIGEEKGKKSLEHLKQILKYIENHYMEKVTVSEAAAETGLSASHFMKYFKNTMGTSFVDYLNDYRLTMAARLLRASDSTVLAIAEEVGYENLSYFNRSFKKKYNTTPSAYRKQR